MVRRFGQVIKIKPEGLEQYKAYHANPLPGVNEMIKETRDLVFDLSQRRLPVYLYGI